MNSEGFGTNGVPYEYTIEKKGKKIARRKMLLILVNMLLNRINNSKQL